MIYIIILSLIIGMFSGYFILPESIISHLNNITSLALNVLILSVGIDFGYNKEIFYELKNKGFRILLIPASIIFGSMVGGAAAGFIFKMPLNLSLSISSGFGWYSLSGIILSKISGAEAGTISFLANVFRELFAVLTISFLASKFNFLTAIAPAGATSMDSTLPLVSESTDKETAVISFINGALLSALVPILVPLLYSIKF